jgi:hypothetical protein
MIKDSKFEVDLTKHTSYAKTQTKCDDCNKVIGSSYANHPDALTLHLKDMDASATETKPMFGGKTKEVHACSEACMASILNKRAAK